AAADELLGAKHRRAECLPREVGDDSPGAGARRGGPALPLHGGRRGAGVAVRFAEVPPPCLEFLARGRALAGAVRLKARRDDECAALAVIEGDQAREKADPAVGNSRPRWWRAEARLEKAAQVVSPVSERASEGKRHVGLVRQFVAGEQRLEKAPRIAVVNLGRTPAPSHLATGAERREREERFG